MEDYCLAEDNFKKDIQEALGRFVTEDNPEIDGQEGMERFVESEEARKTARKKMIPAKKDAKGTLLQREPGGGVGSSRQRWP